MEKYKKFIELFEKWNTKINLVARGEDIIGRHIKNSLAILPYLKNKKSITDIGSGGGFPGLILAMEKIHVKHLVESDGRKCAFLETAKRELGLDELEIINSRIEDLEGFNAETITSRAFASVAETLRLTQNIATPETEYYLLKGQEVGAEIKEAKRTHDFDHETLTNDGATILYIYNVRRRG
ncbi:MAG: 16S rRNA (guanine(527)-N(7))-methyltransferase RsmG [Alphaproteobacteria bacterium]|nr:16S rRNA (guanine(527)-N(7))-methyltransferase RsmG [Alphaproteobacteria bacterium]